MWRRNRRAVCGRARGARGGRSRRRCRSARGAAPSTARRGAAAAASGRGVALVSQCWARDRRQAVVRSRVSSFSFSRAGFLCFMWWSFHFPCRTVVGRDGVAGPCSGEDIPPSEWHHSASDGPKGRQADEEVFVGVVSTGLCFSSCLLHRPTGGRAGGCRRPAWRARAGIMSLFLFLTRARGLGRRRRRRAPCGVPSVLRVLRGCFFLFGFFLFLLCFPCC